MNKAWYHLPGLFEFYDFYKVFLPIFYKYRHYFYEWANIGSIYGSPADCIWGGGRISDGQNNPREVLKLVNEYGISARLTFSNSLIREEHLTDNKCNKLCRMFEECDTSVNLTNNHNIHEESNKIKFKNGVIVHSDLLLEYLRNNYPELYFVSSTTKVITKFDDLLKELEREEYQYVVPDFRLNNQFDKLNTLSQEAKDKLEFLCNECCYIGCNARKRCYESVSEKILGEGTEEHVCTMPGGKEGYSFSKAMSSPAFISNTDIKNKYLPFGFSNFKIEGRGLGNAMLLEFLLYYLTKPEYHIHIREMIYLDAMLDLF